MLIAMAFHALDERREEINRKVLFHLHEQLRKQDRFVMVDNASCEDAKWTLKDWAKQRMDSTIRLITLPRNVGTADAINMAWADRKPGEVCLKMDDDCIVNHPDWIGLLEEVFQRAPDIGICGLKRRDLEERPNHPNSHYLSSLVMLPHKKGERWITVEAVWHVMGTCQAYNPALLDKIGGLYQMQDEGNLYGFDDSLASIRAGKAGFSKCFLVGVDIEHLDPGGDAYTQWKQNQAGQWMGRYQQVAEEFLNGTRPVYYQAKAVHFQGQERRYT